MRSVLVTLIACVGCHFEPPTGGQLAEGEPDARGDVADASAVPVPDGGAPASADASAGPADAASCPSECTTCGIDGTCVIDCDVSVCPSRVVCPPDRPCDVRCSGEGVCANGVDCGGSTSCSVLCVGKDACQGGVICDSPTCAIDCSGEHACRDQVCCGGLSCGGSCTFSDGGCCRCSGC